MKTSDVCKIWLACTSVLPACLRWRKKSGTIQTGDTTYYKSLIPEAKQGLLKNVSMIANMQFCFPK